MNSLPEAPCKHLHATSPFTACRRLVRAVVALRGTMTVRLTRAARSRREAAAIRRTLAEAESLAWETAFPHLVLPLLAEERLRAARLVA